MVQRFAGQNPCCCVLCPSADNNKGSTSVVFPSDAPASPSTQEAIQGMLCMANLQSSSSGGASSLQAWLAAGHERGSAGASGTQRSGKRPIKRPAHHSTDSEEEASMDEQESLGACFKDAEYSKEWKEIYFTVGRFYKKNRGVFFSPGAEMLKDYLKSIGLQECCALQSMECCAL